MKCRKIENHNVCWFNSFGADENGNAIFSNDKKSFDDELEAVKSSLTQRLSILKNELWYDQNYGIPLIDNVISKSIMDVAVMDAVMQQPDVLNIENFISTIINKHEYHCAMNIKTKFGIINNFEIA